MSVQSLLQPLIAGCATGDAAANENSGSRFRRARNHILMVALQRRIRNLKHIEDIP
jgi:hypothetical protein